MRAQFGAATCHGPHGGWGLVVTRAVASLLRGDPAEGDIPGACVLPLTVRGVDRVCDSDGERAPSEPALSPSVGCLGHRPSAFWAVITRPWAASWS